MPEVTIKYTSPKTLEALKGISKYFGFIISKPKSEKKATANKHTSIIQGDPSIDISELNEIFTGKQINAKELRSKSWHVTA